MKKKAQLRGREGSAELRRTTQRPPTKNPLAPPRGQSSGALGKTPAWAAPVAGGLGLLALGWACRGALLGTAVADDYSFLYRLTFQHPLDLFDSMGAAYYWRPLSRQVYFSLVGGWLLRAPGAAAGLNALFLLALFATLYRIARRGFDRPLAVGMALIPLLSEPARVLLGWPSGAQHLLASLGAALALHEALAGRMATAALAALAGVLSHESAFLALPALPLVAWWRTRQPRVTLQWAAVALGVGALWAAGYLMALLHGVHLPAHPNRLPLLLDLPNLLSLAVAASFNLEDLTGPGRELLLGGYGALLLTGFGFLLRRRSRVALRERSSVPLAGAVVFALGVLPLAFLLPDWNSWRAWIPLLALGTALTASLGLVSPWLAAGFVTLRLVALLFAAPAPRVVTDVPPSTTSDLSFVRIARLQRAVGSAHRALVAHHATLPSRAVASYWNMPQMMRVGFQDSLAIRVWYRDSTLVWTMFGGESGLDRHVDAVLEFTVGQASPAAVVETEVVRFFQRGARALLANRALEADSLFTLAARLQSREVGPFAGSLVLNRGVAAYVHGDFPRAEAFAAEALRVDGESAEYWALVALLAYVRGDYAESRYGVVKCLELDPRHKEGLRLARELERIR